MARFVVTRFGVTPIKGLRLQDPAEILLDASGAVGDRDFVLVGPDDRIVTVTGRGALLQLTVRYDPVDSSLSISTDDGGCCDGEVRLGRAVTASLYGQRAIPAHEVVGPWSEQVSEVAGTPLRLLKADERGAGSDLAPVTLLGDGSLRELERRSGLGPLDPRRFRMLIHFRSDAPHVEDTWEGRLVTVGEARLRVGGPVPRCAATTRHPERGDRDAPVVRAIRAYRGLTDTLIGPGVPFGAYADVVAGGRVRLGDELGLQDG